MSKQKFDPHAPIGEGPARTAPVAKPEPKPAPTFKYFAKAHRSGYGRDGHKFSGSAAPFQGEPTDRQKADPYIQWYLNDGGLPGREVTTWDKEQTLLDCDRVRLAADRELRKKLKAQQEHKDNI